MMGRSISFGLSARIRTQSAGDRLSLRDRSSSLKRVALGRMIAAGGTFSFWQILARSEVLGGVLRYSTTSRSAPLSWRIPRAVRLLLQRGLW